MASNAPFFVRIALLRAAPRIARVLAAVFLILGLPVAAAAHPDIDEALADITHHIDAGRACARDYLERAELHRLDGNRAAAWADLERAARLEPRSAEVGLTRAALLLDEGRLGACETALDPVLAEHPQDERALELRANARAAQGRLADAAADLDRLIAAADSPSPDHYVHRARWLEQAGPASWDEALRGIEEGIARLGNVPGLVIEAAEIEARLGRFAESRERLAAFTSAIMSQGHRPPSRERAPLHGPQELAVAPPDPVEPLPGPGEPVITRGPYLQSESCDRIVVRWRTSIGSSGRVRYGTDADHLDQFVDHIDRRREHELTLTGLTPGTRYWYAVGTRAPLAEEDRHVASFTTPPLPGTSVPTRVWAIGDCGVAGSNAAAVRDAYQHWGEDHDTDLWLMLGDNAYLSGTDDEYQASVFDMYPSLLGRCAVWPTRGNHDLTRAGGQNDYYDIFTLPTAGECGGVPSGTEAYYSFDYADIHFVCLDSEGSDRSRSGPMLRWLESDLAATVQPWVVAFWHHPPYSHGSHNSDDPNDSDGRLRDMRENALGILDSAGVDLVLTGHSHSYERSFLLRGHYGPSSTLTQAMVLDAGDGAVDGNGPYYKHTAGKMPLEGSVYAVAGSSSQLTPAPLDHPVMVISLLTLGSVVIDVDGDRLDGHFLDWHGVVRDSFEILKGQGPAGLPVPTAPRSGLAIRTIGPNPAGEGTTFRCALPRAGRATVRVIDAAGRSVRTLVDRDLAAGPHAFPWDGRDAAGARVAAGVFFVELSFGGERRAARFAVVR